MNFRQRTRFLGGDLCVVLRGEIKFDINKQDRIFYGERKVKIKLETTNNESSFIKDEVTSAKIHFTAENSEDEQELRKMYSVFVGQSEFLGIQELPEFGKNNGIKKLALSVVFWERRNGLLFPKDTIV